jgi:hypothetical protein
MALISIGVVAASAHGDRVMLRGGAAPVEGHIRVINDDGVTIEVDQQAAQMISWDRVQGIEQDRPEPNLEAFTELATNLWRARTRIERGDTELAEPILEPLFEKYLGRQSETALVVMEGLLRCRLARGANDLAVVSALEVTRLRLAGATTPSYSMLPPVHDPATALCPYLPPFWTPSPGLSKTVRQLASYDARDQPVVIALAALYRNAAQRQLGQGDASPTPTALPDHAGVRFLNSVCNPSISGIPALLQQAGTIGAWAQAWAQFAFGQAQLTSDDSSAQHAGMLNLLHVPAESSQTQPYLSGLALALVAEALAKSGRSGDADIVRAELQRLHPHHPILGALAARPQASQLIKGGS